MVSMINECVCLWCKCLVFDEYSADQVEVVVFSLERVCDVEQRERERGLLYDANRLKSNMQMKAVLSVCLLLWMMKSQRNTDSAHHTQSWH